MHKGEIANDSLFIISYDVGLFKPLLENTYTDDTKEFLITFQVVPDMDKRAQNFRHWRNISSSTRKRISIKKKTITSISRLSSKRR